MTPAELDAIEQRAKVDALNEETCATCRGASEAPCSHDTLRLVAEVRRLRGLLDDCRLDGRLACDSFAFPHDCYTEDVPDKCSGCLGKALEGAS